MASLSAKAPVRPLSDHVFIHNEYLYTGAHDCLIQLETIVADAKTWLKRPESKSSEWYSTRDGNLVVAHRVEQ